MDVHHHDLTAGTKCDASRQMRGFSPPRKVSFLSSPSNSSTITFFKFPAVLDLFIRIASVFVVKFSLPNLRFNANSFLTIPAKTKHTGLGDSGNGMRPIAPYVISDPTLSHVDSTAQDVQLQSVAEESYLHHGNTIKYARVGYPNVFISLSSKPMQAEDELGIKEVHRLPFSNGCRPKLTVALTRLGSFVFGGLSQAANITPHATSIRIFIGHGLKDRIITLNRPRLSIAALKQLGFRVHTGTSESNGVAYNIY
ncbi:uncharacterized protein BT62DRAFT_1014270 [Guyanagaster necrorhizus]|uniref:Uncharacterized protein n=1 Tax=Guyanagaster necrorhizus TaxID=856835 RepID=A0A9P8AKY0_9AGAR|nr:uncharacterized protein BT62DRAFT_1014270 [Guyanagaster necrorhizus MCA 3950]KAG7439175.1 hypothetical protein BT62DRAFT_1014270 [Guyanagaster necrorhizus MCA 3950]